MTAQASDLKRAFDLHRSGQLAQAEQHYRTVLAAEPRNFHALHLLGTLCTQENRAEEASALFERALQVPAEDPDGLFDRAVLLEWLTRFDEALESYDRAIEMRPDHAAALYNRGSLAERTNQLDRALASYDRLLALQPDHPEALFNRALTLAKLDRLPEALAGFDRVLAAQPGHAVALRARGMMLERLDHPDEALAAYDLVLETQPADPDALLRRSALLGSMGRLEEALRSFNRTLQVRPNDAEVLYSRATALRTMNHFLAALAGYDTLLELHPDHLDGALGRADVLTKLGVFDDALTCLDRILQIDAKNRRALDAKADALWQSKRFGEAGGALEQLLALDPTYRSALSRLLAVRLRDCNWQDYGDLRARIEAAAARGEAAEQPWQSFMYCRSATQQLGYARAYAAESYPAPAPAPAIGQARRPDSRIKLAWISPDFRSHPTTMLMTELFELQDRDRFEVLGISFGSDDGSELRQRVERSFDRFVDVQHWSDQETVRWMREQQIDIAVDLAGFTKDNRFGLFTGRSAPVQAGHVGYPGTAGSAALDYFFADGHVVPPGSERFFSEKIVRLPDCYLMNDRKRVIAEATPSRRELGLPENGFVFCCFNKSTKILPDVFDVWMRLLRDIDGSVLWLLQEASSTAANLRREAGRRGVSADRLVFAPEWPIEQHLARHRAADLFVDTNPCNAHTTAIDALWAGLPLVTWSGEALASRAAGSMLKSVGLPELVTYSLADYEALIRRLVAAPATLAGMRSRLGRDRLSLPLFDTDRYRRHIEAAFVTMHGRCLRGLPPESFDVPVLSA